MTVEVFRDAWGVPHLRAGSAAELAWAQGRNAALDRGRQLEVERHRAQGTSAAFLGPEALPWDRFARRARLDDTARHCHHALDPATRAWVDAYVSGVNAGLAQLPAEQLHFAHAKLRSRPWRPWTPLALWLSHHVLFAGFPTKLWRAHVARHLGPEHAELFATDGPFGSGSNGWLAGGDRTRSGQPLIAGDPHRFVERPGIYQQIRLACPEFDVLGLAVPGVPGLAHFGHAGSVAWAITNAMADYQDLYHERLRRAADGTTQALGPDGWEPVTVRQDAVEVAGAEPVVLELLETPRGPVLFETEDGAVSLRTFPRATGDLGFAALPALLRARTAADVDRALDSWVEPVNVVLAADRWGGLLHRVAGAVPRRDRANLLRPVPAWLPEHRWDGLQPLPRADVRDGLAVMANERGLAAGLGAEFAPPHRADRIRTLLQAGRDWTPETMAGIHTDTHLASAATLLDLAATLDGLSPAAEDLRDRLAAWDRDMDADSRDAALFAAFRAATVRALAADPGLSPAATANPYPDVFQPWLALRPRIAHALPAVLGSGLVDGPGAIRAALESTATAPPTGDWGDAHRLTAWSTLPDDPSTPLPRLGGDHDCVLSTSSIPGVTDAAARGPAARYVWDLADRAASRWIVPHGAHGSPDHPHSCDQLPLWQRGELLPVTTDWNLLTKEETVPADRSPVHTALVPGFGRVDIAPVDPDADADLIHAWVTRPRARFWGMLDADRARVHEIYSYLDSLTTHHAYLIRQDGRPVALFQTYEPEHDEVGAYYPVQPGDFGIHLFVAEAEPGDDRRPGFTDVLIRQILAFVLIDERRLRLVVEPDARNERAVARLQRAGFTLGPLLDLPHKRAQLAFLPRNSFTRHQSLSDK